MVFNIVFFIDVCFIIYRIFKYLICCHGFNIVFFIVEYFIIYNIQTLHLKPII